MWYGGELWDGGCGGLEAGGGGRRGGGSWREGDVEVYNQMNCEPEVDSPPCVHGRHMK